MQPHNTPARAGAGRGAPRSFVHTHAYPEATNPFQKLDPFSIAEPRLEGVAFITSRRVGRDAFLFAEDGGDGESGGGGDPPSDKETPAPRSFTQAELDRVVGQRLAEERKRFAGFDDIKARAAKVDELEAELLKLREDAETRGKSADEKQRIEAERARKQIERERAEYQTKLEAEAKRATDLEGRLRTREISLALGTALDAAKVLPQARDKAIRAFVADSQIEIDDNYQVTGISYAGVAYDTTAKAAAAFLKDNDFFAAGNFTPGGGTKPPNGGGVGGLDVRKQTAEENFAAGLSSPPRPVPGLSGA